MYKLTVKNNYVWQIEADNGAVKIPEHSGTHTFTESGSVYLQIPGIGQIAFIDLGENKLEGYPEVTETWGVLIRANSTEGYYRYEGGGNLSAVFDGNGTCTLSTTNGTLIPIYLEELIVDTTGIKIN